MTVAALGISFWKFNNIVTLPTFFKEALLKIVTRNLLNQRQMPYQKCVKH